MSGLGLIPNEVVGWRIKPDWYNFTVVIVKKYGVSSKRAGQEYEEPLAYCRSLEHAAEWLTQHVTRIEGERLQAEAQAVNGSVANVEALLAAMTVAQNAVLAAVQELSAKLVAAGLNKPRDVLLLSGAAEPDLDAA